MILCLEIQHKHPLFRNIHKYQRLLFMNPKLFTITLFDEQKLRESVFCDEGHKPYRNTCAPRDSSADVMIYDAGPQRFTVGIRDDTPNNEIVRLRGLGAEFRKTNRGGLITFHGPGQLVAYPIINLKHFKTSVKWYVQSLEETVINVCDELGIKGTRSPYTGVWVDDNKIAAIGIHASRYVTTHGVSLNCDNDLSWFNNIDPCGIEDKGVTSLTKESGIECTVEKVTPIFLKCFNKVFGCQTEDIDVKTQEEILNSIYNKLLIHNIGS